MLKKLLFAFLLPLLYCQFAVAQIPITITSSTATGKLLGGGPYGCSVSQTSSASVVYYPNGTYVPGAPGGALWTSGTGSNVTGGVLNCTDPCDTSVIEVTLNLQWQKGPDNNWVHGVFFPTVAGYGFLGTTLSPASWIYTPLGCTGTTPCGSNPGELGSAGYYFSGPGQSCCPGGGSTPTPCDNYGDPTYQCGTPMVFKFIARICNNSITGNTFFLRIRVTADGNTGCWSVAQNAASGTNLLTFAFATNPCTPLFPSTSVNQPVKTCTPAPDYTSTFIAPCGNGNTVTWWDQQFGGNQVGTGSPFVYHWSTCPPANFTLYANCCNPVLGNTCAIRKPVGYVNYTCPAPFTISGAGVDPTCANPTAGTVTATPSNANGTVTYTINPGGTSNTTGVFGGLGGGTYTVTAIDGGGCSATTTVTLTTAPGGGAAPTVTTPVNYCQNAAATPLTATGTNLMWYTVPTGGTGTATAPTPITTTVGSTTYYVSQNPSGSCESPRAAIVVNVTATSTITLTSAAGTNAQTVCVNTPILNIVYTTGAGATGATVGGLPAVLPVFIPAELTALLPSAVHLPPLWVVRLPILLIQQEVAVWQQLRAPLQ